MESIPAEKKTTGQKPIIDLRSVTKVYRVGSVDVHARGILLHNRPKRQRQIHPFEHAGGA